jgi:hypothetical protein
MGGGFSTSITKIWRELCAIESEEIRIRMLETLLSVPEYREEARRAGVHGPISAWMLTLDGPFPYASTRVVENQMIISPAAKALDYFQEALILLGIGENESLTYERLRSAYKKASLRSHPDKGGSKEAFDEIARAYQYTEKILQRISPPTSAEEKKRMTAPVTMESAMGMRAAAPVEVTGPPVQLSAKKLDMSLFNKLFEDHRLPDPDRDSGYGDWLNRQGGPDAPEEDARLKGKFNQTMFEQVFREKALAQNKSTAIVRKLEPDAIMPVQGVELGGRAENFTAAFGSDTQFTDLKHAYTDGSTVYQEVAGVQAKERSVRSVREAQKHRDTEMSRVDPDEGARIAAAAAALEERERQRRLRVAQTDTEAESWSSHIRRRMLVSDIQ